jgi:hypothetical protein
METGMLPSRNLENQPEPCFTRLPFTALSKVLPVPYHCQEKKDRRLCGWAAISSIEGAEGEENMQH